MTGSRVLKKIKKQRTLLLFVLPAAVAIVLFSYMPMMGVVMAFKKFRLGQSFLSGEWVGLMNFQKFWSSNEFWRALRNTVGINGLGIFVGFPIGGICSTHNSRASVLWIMK